MFRLSNLNWFFDNFCPKLQKRLNSGYEREPENLRDNTKYSEFTS